MSSTSWRISYKILLRTDCMGISISHVQYAMGIAAETYHVMWLQPSLSSTIALHL
jgi:hypothetical protein